MTIGILKNKNRTLLGIINLAILTTLFIVGLWPFDFRPENKATWLEDKTGIRFYGKGIVHSQQPIPIASFNPMSIEIWLQAEGEPNRSLPRIVSVYDLNGPHAFFIGQWKSSLIIRKWATGQEEPRLYRDIAIGDALPGRKPRCMAVTSDERGTSIYLDGHLKKFFPKFVLMPDNGKGRINIVLGNSPSGKAFWKGDLFGLAIFRTLLTPEQVLRHYTDWKEHQGASIVNEESLISLYRFNEGKGNSTYDQTNQYPLAIPSIFVPAQRVLLSYPWHDPYLRSPYVKDIMINIAGFLPFGFFLFAFFRKSRNKSVTMAFLLTLAAGFLISLIIEIVQAYLPSRSSQLMDVITNGFGTMLGILLSHYGFCRK